MRLRESSASRGALRGAGMDTPGDGHSAHPAVVAPGAKESDHQGVTVLPHDVARCGRDDDGEPPPPSKSSHRNVSAYIGAQEDGGGGVNTLPARTRAVIRDHTWQFMMAEWGRYLSDPTFPGRQTVGAIYPVLQEWVDGARRGISFRTTQVLSGHGCFDSYLCRIGKEVTAHCTDEEDTADHTLSQCPAWEEDRLIAHIRVDLALPVVIEATMQGEEKWVTFSSFCEKVISQKEEAERERRGEGSLQNRAQRAARRARQQRRALARIARAPPPPLFPASPNNATNARGGGQDGRSD